MRTYLFQDGPITEIEERATGKDSANGAPSAGPGGDGRASSSQGSLGLGSLRGLAQVSVSSEEG